MIGEVWGGLSWKFSNEKDWLEKEGCINGMKK